MKFSGSKSKAVLGIEIKGQNMVDWTVEWHTVLLFGPLGSHYITIKPKKDILCSQGLLNSSVEA